jgi:FAD-linked oxidoreductase
VPPETTARWTNWAGNQSALPLREVRPANVKGIVEAVLAARDDRLRVKAAGSGHSFTDIAATDGVLIRLDNCANVLGLDAVSRLVTVQAGMPLHRLNLVLDQAGLAMTNLGDVDVQTISGAVATGTHGTGARLGGIATQIRGLELVLADGSVVACSPKERPELFAAARVGLGALGIVASVTLHCEPAFDLRAEEGPMPIQEAIDRLDELVEDNEHFEFWWFPYSDVALTRRNNRLPAGTEPKPPGRFRAWFDDELLANTVLGLMWRTGRRFPDVVPALNRLASRAQSTRTYSDRSHRVFASARRNRFVEMEYAVPRETAGDVLKEVRILTGRLDVRIPIPVELRFAAADDIWLSTAYQRESAYLAVHQFVGMPYERYFREVEAIMSDVGGRPHWGKLHFLQAADLRERYPRFDEFVRLRDELDPAGMFANDYLDRVLGPPGGLRDRLPPPEMPQ